MRSIFKCRVAQYIVINNCMLSSIRTQKYVEYPDWQKYCFTPCNAVLYGRCYYFPSSVSRTIWENVACLYNAD